MRANYAGWSTPSPGKCGTKFVGNTKEAVPLKGLPRCLGRSQTTEYLHHLTVVGAPGYPEVEGAVLLGQGCLATSRGLLFTNSVAVWCVRYSRWEILTGRVAAVSGELDC